MSFLWQVVSTETRTTPEGETSTILSLINDKLYFSDTVQKYVCCIVINMFCRAHETQSASDLENANSSSLNKEIHWKYCCIENNSVSVHVSLKHHPTDPTSNRKHGCPSGRFSSSTALSDIWVWISIIRELWRTKRREILSLLRLIAGNISLFFKVNTSLSFWTIAQKKAVNYIERKTKHITTHHRDKTKTYK